MIDPPIPRTAVTTLPVPIWAIAERGSLSWLHSSSLARDKPNEAHDEGDDLASLGPYLRVGANEAESACSWRPAKPAPNAAEHTSLEAAVEALATALHDDLTAPQRDF